MLSLDALSVDELSFDELSFDELSRAELALGAALGVSGKAGVAVWRGGCRISGRQHVRGVQLAKLTLNVTLELLAVLTLECAQFIDAGLEGCALLLEGTEL